MGTGTHAKPRLSADTVTSVTPNWQLTLEQAGPAMLAGIMPLGKAALGPQKVGIKTLGQDRYGRQRIIAYREGRKDSVQEELLAAGEALFYDRAASPKAWVVAEASARRHKKGVWGDKDLVLAPAQASAAVGAFHLVQGNVTRTYKSRDTYYLNFGEDWKTDFSLRIPKRAWRAFGKDFTVADGSCVRARGVIFLENGPMIELTRPEQLERLDANACRG